MSGRASRTYLVAGGLAVCCYFVPPLAGSPVLFELVGLSAAVALVVGMARYRPRPALPWTLFLVAQVLFLCGDFFYYTYDLSFPSYADGLYLAYYPVQAAGLFLLVRSRATGKDWGGVLDALIITVGFGLVSWIYLVEPSTHDAGVGMATSLVSGAYPVMDVLLLAFVVRLLMGRGARSPAFILMTASVLCLVVTDSVYSFIEVTGTYDTGGVLDAGWMSAYLLWGGAALHPSMRELSSKPAAGTATLTGRRVLLLAGATLVAPGSLLVDRIWPTEGYDVEVAAAASAVLFILVLVRVQVLVSSLREAVDRHQRVELRETILRRAATTLTAAPDRDFVRLAVIEGAGALTSDLPGVEIDVDLSRSGARHRDGVVPPGAVVVSLATRAAPYGRLVVTSSAPLPGHVVEALDTLGAQAALALEAIALVDGLSEQRIEGRVGALVQNSSDMILLIDADLVIRYVTPSVAVRLGREPEQLIGCGADTLSEPADRAMVRDFYERIMREPGKSVTAEWRMRRADGELTDFEAVVTNMLANPSVRGIVVTAHDITERKALEAGLKRHVAELEELDRIRNEFVATVSHELRTPLTNIVGEIEMLVDGDRGELTDCQAQGVDVIGRNSERLLSLVDDLLTLSQVESSGLKLRYAPTQVARLLDGVRTRVLPAAEAKQIEVTLECSDDAGQMMADGAQLDRALANLLSNAVKFTPKHGAVRFTAHRVGDEMEFVVADTGVGIPLEEQVRLFTRFFRSSVATRLATQGSGLGLVIVKQIVEAHGGSIGVVSVPDEGTTVTVHIPAGDTVDARSDAA